MYAGIGAASSSSSLIGVGITMEGIWQNYPAFEYTLSFAWSNSTPTDFIADYAGRRYSQPASPAVLRAWQTLLAVAYSGGGIFGSLVTTYPTMQDGPAWKKILTRRGFGAAAKRSDQALYPMALPSMPEGGLASGDQCAYGEVMILIFLSVMSLSLLS